MSYQQFGEECRNSRHNVDKVEAALTRPKPSIEELDATLQAVTLQSRSALIPENDTQREETTATDSRPVRVEFLLLLFLLLLLLSLLL